MVWVKQERPHSRPPSLTLLEIEGARLLGGSLGVLLGCGIMGAPSALWEGVAGSFSTKTEPERSVPAPEGRPVCREDGNEKEAWREKEEQRRQAIKIEKYRFVCVCGFFLSSLQNKERQPILILLLSAQEMTK